MRPVCIAIIAALALVAATAVRADDPRPTPPGVSHEVAVDSTFKAIVSDERVLATMNQMVARFGGALSLVEVTSIRPGGSTYRLHFQRTKESPLDPEVGYFEVQVGFGAMMKPHVSSVGQPVLAR